MNVTTHDHGKAGPAVAGRHHGHAGGNYARLAAMVLVSFAVMFVFMYAMVDRFANAVPNVNQLYMAGLMAAPMLVIEIVLMRAMYPNRVANIALVVLGAALTVGCWSAIRQQSGIGDRQFLKSMIPHHAGAVLMCEESSISDPDIQRLCAGIVASQQDEIRQMKALLAREDAVANNR